jgi:hypothetical protein
MPGTERVKLNGIIQRRTVDYTPTGSTGIIEFVFDLRGFDVVTVTYRSWV